MLVPWLVLARGRPAGIAQLAEHGQHRVHLTREPGAGAGRDPRAERTPLVDAADGPSADGPDGDVVPAGAVSQPPAASASASAVSGRKPALRAPPSAAMTRADARAGMA